jgi:hypothetical protein
MWMIYGYDKTSLTDLTSYDRTLFILWLATFSRPLDQDVIKT